MSIQLHLLLEKALILGGEEGVNLLDVRSCDRDRFDGSSWRNNRACNMLFDVDQPVISTLEPGEACVQDTPVKICPGVVIKGVPEVAKHGEALGVRPWAAQARQEFIPIETGALVEDPANSCRGKIRFTACGTPRAWDKVGGGGCANGGGALKAGGGGVRSSRRRRKRRARPMASESLRQRRLVYRFRKAGRGRRRTKRRC